MNHLQAGSQQWKETMKYYKKHNHTHNKQVMQSVNLIFGLLTLTHADNDYFYYP